MKKILLLNILVVLFCLQASAQQKPQKKDSFKSPFSTKSSTGPLKPMAPKSGIQKRIQKEKVQEKGSAFLRVQKKEVVTLADLKSKFGLSDQISLKEVAVHSDKQGFKHESFQQYYKGLPVEGFVLFKHTNKESILHGKVAEIENLDTAPALSESEAKNIAMSSLGVDKVLREYPVDLKVLKLPKNDVFALAYEVRIDAVKPFLMKKVFVDAKTGEILKTRELVPHADTPGTAQTFYSGTRNITIDDNNGSYRLRESSRKIETYDATHAELTDMGFEGFSDFENTSASWESSLYLSSFAVSEASAWWYNSIVDTKADFYIIVKDGADKVVFKSSYLNETNTPVTFYPNLRLMNGPYSVEIWDYDTGDAHDFGGTYSISLTGGTQNYSDEHNTGSYVISELNNPALDVHWGMEVTYDFFMNAFGRDSYDGLGGTIKQYLNPLNLQKHLGNNPNNAYAIGAPYNIMAYGLGDGTDMGPVVGIDVEGHEFSHLVVGNNGNGGLDYEGESGALNESFADIFGVGVEFYSGVNPDWTMGEDIMINEPFLRSISNPNATGNPDTYEGAHWVNPENLSYDHGGVHINSGVQNFWFYLLSEGGSGTNDKGNDYAVSGIGMEKASQIAYRNLISYLGPNATYYDAYHGSLQSAEDLYGNPSSEYEAVRNAWYAVGIGSAPDVSCDGLTQLTASSATVSDGSGSANYGTQLNCSWLIAPSGANQITLDFTAFDTEAEYDTLFVYDGPTEEDELLLTWWGNTLPPQITSSAGAMLIRFSSDENNTAAGWSANYTSSGSGSLCEELSLLTASEGSFEDGSGNAVYGNNAECYWYIAPPCASSVTLSFSAFDTELDYDGVVVYDGLSEDAVEIAVLTGSEIPADITSTTGEMLLVFVSDHSMAQQGFSASYTSEGAAFCSGTTQVADSDYGVISDGSGADNYCNNQECRWLISPPDAESITLYFTEFDLEPAEEDGRTIYDAIEVYDGDSESAKLIGTYTGNSIPPPIASSGGSLFLKFYSDISVNQGGWEFEYVTETQTFCEGTKIVTNTEGELNDGSSAKDYGNNSICSWLIKPENAEKVTLSFTEFDLEEGYDAVVVYDGEDARAPILATLSGASLPGDISSSNGTLYLEFLSDPAVRKSGWKASYRTESILGLAEDFFKGIKVYPNPASGFFNVENQHHKEIEISVTDMVGRELMKPASLKNGMTRINIEGLSRGLYLINFIVEGQDYPHKIMIE